MESCAVFGHPVVSKRISPELIEEVKISLGFIAMLLLIPLLAAAFALVRLGITLVRTLSNWPKVTKRLARKPQTVPKQNL